MNLGETAEIEIVSILERIRAILLPLAMSVRRKDAAVVNLSRKSNKLKLSLIKMNEPRNSWER